MIDRLTGTVLCVDEQLVVVQTSGIGFAVHVPQSALLQENEQVTLMVHFHWNQEHGPSLFGFKTAAERTLFVLVIGCSGVGPKIGLAIIAQLGIKGLVKAIQEHDQAAFSHVSGIGAKKAEQLLVYLKHKVHSSMIQSLCVGDNDPKGIDWHTLTQTLESLRYSRLEIARAMTHLREVHHDEHPLSFDHMLKRALSFLSRSA